MKAAGEKQDFSGMLVMHIGNIFISDKIQFTQKLLGGKRMLVMKFCPHYAAYVREKTTVN